MLVTVQKLQTDPSHIPNRFRLKPQTGPGINPKPALENLKQVQVETPH